MTPHDAQPSPFKTSGDTPLRSGNALKTSVIIGLCCLLIYNLNGRSISAGDTYPARYLPFAILQYHTVFMNPVAEVAAQGRGDTAFWILHLPDGHLMSLYPVVVPLVVAPLYVPAILYLHVRGWTDARLDYVAKVMEKLSASFLAALSVSLIYLLLRRRTAAPTALLLTLAYAFGTTTWVISSQALWQHGLAELLLIMVLLLLTGPYSAARAVAVGLLCGVVACNRPPDAILAGALGVYALIWAGSRGRAFLLAAAAALPMLFVLAYNLRFAGNVAGGYGVIGSSRFFDHPIIPGVAGLLISPAKGLFVFSPFLLVLFSPWREREESRQQRTLTLLMAGSVIIQLVLYAKVDWRGGLSWGPRYMTDLLPFLMWLITPAVARLRGAARACFLVAIAVSVVFEAIGAFAYSGPIDNAIYAMDLKIEGQGMVTTPTWQWQNAAFLSSVRSGFAPPDLWSEPRGTFDGIEVNGRPVSVITAGQETFATGWALVGHATPSHVGVMIDGRQGFASGTFTPREDVRTALHEASPSGWRVRLDTSQLTAGEHHLSLLVWSSGRGDGHYIGERSVTVRRAFQSSSGVPIAATQHSSAAAEPAGETDLESDFREAVSRLQEHQQPAGSWLTSYTTEARFHDARPEMNTFLTAVLIDLLNPVAANSGLEPALQQARRHLTSQIESGGLVRYHGLPNAPGIGTLGCAITPDTDNTALTWRVAPAPDRARLMAALSTIDRYRTADGLYRTWLAPREEYQCLDPGRDPNPADIAIQMHLLMLLSEVRPPASHALCEALRPRLNDDRIWVYYQRTPLVPILRMADLHHDGCDLELPESRMRSDVPGQAAWISMARWLSASTMPKSSPPDAVLMRALLRELARNDFAFVRTNPPLLYHNDLTATVSRYYWSEDAGYALWLRLYREYGLHAHPAVGG
jgi:hypothetical protein